MRRAELKKKKIIAEHMVDNDAFDDEVLQGLTGGVAIIHVDFNKFPEFFSTGI